jgi:diguanylate cyclase (GGDEF)-like protein
MSDTIHWILTTVGENPLIVLCVVAILVMMVVSVLALKSARKSRSEIRFGEDGLGLPTHNSGRPPSMHSGLDSGRALGPSESSPGSDGGGSDVQRMSKILKDLRSDNQDLRDDILHLKNLNSLLPPMVKELNSEVRPEKMGELVLRAVERLFNPGLVMIFFRNPGEEDLDLVASTGVVVPPGDFQAELGYGIAGLAAAKMVTITREDLKNESNLVLSQLDEADPILNGMDIACPIRSRDKCIGVICLGLLRAESEDVRAVLNMVGEMAGMALSGARQYQKIQDMANSDPLTGLTNKGRFLKVCSEVFHDAPTRGRPVSIAMFDLDNFKHYNDENGHLAGDQALKAIAEILREHSRENDTPARFGGEEFILLMPDTDHTVACEVAERIRLGVKNCDVQHSEKQPLGFLSISGGIATVPLHGTGMEEIIERSDVAMYQAKKTGRDRVVSANLAASSMEMASSGGS